MRGIIAKAEHGVKDFAATFIAQFTKANVKPPKLEFKSFTLITTKTLNQDALAVIGTVNSCVGEICLQPAQDLLPFAV